MAYTRVWDNAAPPDGRDADEIGQAFREFRVDVYQRLASFFIDIDNDPLIPIAAYSGAVTGRRLMLSAFAIAWRDPSMITLTPGSGYVRLVVPAIGFGGHGMLPVIVPTGYEITQIDARYTGSTGDTFTFALYGVNTITGVVTNLSGNVATVGNNAIQTPISVVFSHTALDSETFFVQFDAPLSASVNIMGFRIIINKSNNSTGY